MDGQRDGIIRDGAGEFRGGNLGSRREARVQPNAEGIGSPEDAEPAIDPSIIRRCSDADATSTRNCELANADDGRHVNARHCRHVNAGSFDARLRDAWQWKIELGGHAQRAQHRPRHSSDLGRLRSSQRDDVWDLANEHPIDIAIVGDECGLVGRRDEPHRR
ncbi:MAG: hypothetical protein H0T79_07270 [Deltaproteobacteria bacterium]|nr:hypothetical protein [Deltaproteobacteria bacterium]